jgi:transposase
MASLDKSSVRQEVSRLKTEFQRLVAEGHLSQEVQAMMASLLMMVDLILAVFLEKNTTKTSAKSSKPPSQTAKDDSALGRPGHHGKAKRTDEDAVHNTRTVETVTVTPVEICDHCGESLIASPCIGHERRTRVDIVFEKVVEHVDAEMKQCPTCNHTVKGQFPAALKGPLQYGPGVKAWVINLLVCHMVSLNRVQALLSSMLNVVIAEASLLKFVRQLHQALEDWEHRMIEQLLNAPSLHVDETSLRVDRKNHWIHVYSSGHLTLKFCHRKRGKEAIESINIIPRYGGAIIHDCWSAYLSYTHCRHGLCGSHLLRELTFIFEAQGYRWAIRMKRLLQSACLEVSKRPDKRLSDPEIARLQKRYRTILTQGKKELPVILPKPNGKRGKLAKSDAHNLWERLKLHEPAVLLFAQDPHVSFTNNRAEQDLRMAKVKQKVSGCFRSELYAHAYCRISSYLQTMANRGVNPLIAIQLALVGKID